MNNLTETGVSAATVDTFQSRLGRQIKFSFVLWHMVYQLSQA